MQQIEGRIAQAGSLGCIVGRWQIDHKRSPLAMEGGAHKTICNNCPLCWQIRRTAVSNSWRIVQSDIRGKEKEIRRGAGQNEEYEHSECSQRGEKYISQIGMTLWGIWQVFLNGAMGIGG